MNLVFSDLRAPGFARVRRGEGFDYRTPGGGPASARARRRIEKLVIPPAWNDVWISPDPHGHIQAFGRDDRGRRQYIYHGDFRAHREKQKFGRLARIAAALPAMRRRVADDMKNDAVSRERVLATVVFLLDRTRIRIGNPAYARDNRSFGLTTLRCRHVRFERGKVALRFNGKGGKEWRAMLDHARVVKTIRECHELPGQNLFQYLDDANEVRTVGSADVNAYLREISGESISAKDFRTWSATARAFQLLGEAWTRGEAFTTKRVNAIVKQVAEELGNTPAICRASYIHPRLFEACESGALARFFARRAKSPRKVDPLFGAHEAAALAFLKTRRIRSRASGEAARSGARRSSLATRAEAFHASA